MTQNILTAPPSPDRLMDNNLNPDRFYTAEEFAFFMGVHKQLIYQSQEPHHTPRLPLHVPRPIKIGERGLRWTGRQIKDYQTKLAALSGVDIPDDDPPAVEHKASKPGRPRNV